MTTFTPVGFDRFARKLEAMPARVQAEGADELEAIADDLGGDVLPITPYREDPLRSHWFDYVARSANGATMEAGFDGPRDYLLVQHEGGWLNYRGEYGPKKIKHYTTPGTGPKFLETPWAANKEGYKRRLREAVRKGVRG